MTKKAATPPPITAARFFRSPASISCRLDQKSQQLHPLCLQYSDERFGYRSAQMSHRSERHRPYAKVKAAFNFAADGTVTSGPRQTSAQIASVNSAASMREQGILDWMGDVNDVDQLLADSVPDGLSERWPTAWPTTR